MTGGGAMTISSLDVSPFYRVFALTGKAEQFFVEPDGRPFVGDFVIRKVTHIRTAAERTMAPFQTNPAAISQDMVIRVGTAAGLVARIQQDYAVQAEAESADEARSALAAEARAAAERVLDEKGLSIQDYNAVLTAAKSNNDLERRLIDAAREVL
jgi:hypothetical protein